MGDDDDFNTMRNGVFQIMIDSKFPISVNDALKIFKNLVTPVSDSKSKTGIIMSYDDKKKLLTESYVLPPDKLEYKKQKNYLMKLINKKSSNLKTYLSDKIFNIFDLKDKKYIITLLYTNGFSEIADHLKTI